MHTSACLEQQLARRIWINRWPNACPQCEGAGVHYYPSTRWEPEDYAICECIDERNQCPRCGAALPALDDLDGAIVCATCGWNSLHADIRPSVDCDCDGQY